MSANNYQNSFYSGPVLMGKNRRIGYTLLRLQCCMLWLLKISTLPILLSLGVIANCRQWGHVTQYIYSSPFFEYKVEVFFFSCHFLLMLGYISERNIVYTAVI